ncbi:MAG TPA: phosphatase PAP2 family protein [Desulfovibrio sp.]|uniref:phosphatase PAP2 family protein n=1 Tax=Desulfovibrio sp. TaxID=885 RepID=UPI002BF5E930|nr:phosphatase PAP2 family protein [Desulfovibrio sp.]HMM39052.1 phosphatase PAP2 family protein [Desulfovibrio sp.]
MSWSRILLGWLRFSWPLLLVLLVLWLAFGGNEAAVEAFFRAHREANSGLAAVMRGITDWSNPPFYAVYAWLLWRGWREKRPDLTRLALAYVAVQLVVSLLAVRGLKMLIGRPRPDAGPFFEPMTTDPGHHSLPSGHTTEITGATLPLALRSAGRLIPPALALLTALTGFSRVYLGWHHPSDVFFGWLLGSVAGLAIHLLATKDEHAGLS